MQSSLKLPALACKAFANIEAIAAGCFMIGLFIHQLQATTPPRDARDWGTPAYYHRLYSSIAIVALVVILVSTPNRWLVFSRLVLGPLLVVALMPLCFSLFLIASDFDLIFSDFFGTATVWAVIVFFSAPWPLSLIFSRMRLRRGETFTYA